MPYPSNSDVNVLSSVKVDDVKAHPFPHIVIKNALPQDIYDALDSTHPLNYYTTSTINQFKNKQEDNIVPYEGYDSALISRYCRDDRGHTKRLYLPPSSESTFLSKVWTNYIDFHTSNFFFRYICKEILGKYLDLCYPHLSQFIDNYKGQISRRKVNPQTGIPVINPKKPLQTHCVFVNNKPQESGFSSRTAHIDHASQIYTIILYMRDKSDKSTGGGLELYENKLDREEIVYDKRIGAGRQIMKGKGNLFSLIPYEANTAVVFLNTPVSIHGVEPIFNQTCERRSVVVSGQTIDTIQLFKI